MWVTQAGTRTDHRPGSAFSRVRVGVLLPELDGEFYRPLVAGICREADLLGIDLFFFPGHLPATPILWERQLGAAFKLVHRQNVDGLLILASTLQFHVDRNGLRKFVAQFDHLPFVCVGHAHEGRPALMLENHAGYRQLVEHFIHVHGHRRIAMIEGPPENRDAEERLRAYLDAHEAAGLVPDPRLRRPGNFAQPTARAAIEALWRDGLEFSAVLCANDDMAHAVLAAAVEKGIRVPEALAVGGFDDMLSVRQSGPSLTTVNQGLDTQGGLGLRLLLDEMAGRATPDITPIDTRLVLRRSCGCRDSDLLVPAGLSTSDEVAGLAAAIDAPPALASRLPGDILALRDALLCTDGGARFEATLLQLAGVWTTQGGDVPRLQKLLLGLRRLVSRDLTAARTADVFDRLLQGQMLLMDATEMSQNQEDVVRRSTALDFHNEFKSRVATDDLDDLLGSLHGALRKLNVPNCCIALYDQPCTIEQMHSDGVPVNSRIIFAMRDGESLTALSHCSFATADLGPADIWRRDHPTARVVLPLFYLTHHFGFAIVDRRPDGQMHHEELRHELAMHIHHCLLVRELAGARDLLRSDLARATEDNETLAHLAMRDALTGLLNRRGFFERAEAWLTASRMAGRTLTAIFADLDGLKPINDTHGHEEGDQAIREAGRLLREVFRADDIVGRIGGDEFAVLTASTDLEAVPLIASRVRQAFERYNASSRKPYALWCSVGGCAIPAGSAEPLERLLAQADRLLYEEKRLKRVRRA